MIHFDESIVFTNERIVLKRLIRVNMMINITMLKKRSRFFFFYLLTRVPVYLRVKSLIQRGKKFFLNHDRKYLVIAF